MKNFIVYSVTGEIIRTGSCSDDDLELQAGVNQLVIEGEANDSKQMIANGFVVNKPPVKPLPFNIEAARAIKTIEIVQACEVHIVSGFSSNALGLVHFYPSNRDDQLNLSGTVQRSMLAGVLPADVFLFLCMNVVSEWNYRPHDISQIQQVGKDAYSHILNSRIKNATLQAQASAAINQAALDLIKW